MRKINFKVVSLQIQKNSPVYEEHAEVIDREIRKRKAKWHLTAISYMDFEDVIQIIKLHILNKIHTYDKDKSAFVNWLNRLISNQISNLLRNHYGAFSKVCNKCHAADGETGCSIYGEQCVKCPAYKNWAMSKKGAYNVKIPLSTENHFNEVSNLPQESIDFDRSLADFSNKLTNQLNHFESQVFRLVYIEHRTELQTASVIFKKSVTSVSDQQIKSIENAKDRILAKAKKYIFSDDSDFCWSH